MPSGYYKRKLKGFFEKCSNCSKKYYIYQYEKGKRKFCSKKCFDISQKGKLGWNKGISLTEKHKENLSKAWNYNKHLKGIEHLRKLAKLRIGKKREPFSKSWRENISLSHKGKISPRKGIKLTEETIKKIKKARARQILPVKDTSIEVKIQNFLKLLHLEFMTHYWMRNIQHSYQCDILIPKQKGISQKTIIECDGCYWHGCPICNLTPHKDLLKLKMNDNDRTKELIEKGFRVIRLWEHDIRKMEVNEFKGRLNGLQ